MMTTATCTSVRTAATSFRRGRRAPLDLPPPEGRINCGTLGDYIDNTRLDYVVRDLTTNVTNTVSTHPINTRNGFGGGFFGDYTDLAVGSDNVFHAFWTDSNNKQSVVWFYGFQFVPTLINQEDVAAASGNY